MRRIAIAATLSWGAALLLGCGGTAAPPPPSPAPGGGPPGSASPSTGKATGASDSLSAQQLGDQHVTDIAELLEGKVAGLQVVRLPNGDISLRIRGGDLSLRPGADGSSIVAAPEGEPLLVIDGMPVSEGQLSSALRTLNPHEIDNIRVLKDVSSTSVYGIRGAHGVILITTKHD